MDMQLKDKVAVITGGSIGIGEAVARALAREGVHLAICARGKDRLDETVRKISDEYKVKAYGIQADVSCAEDINQFVKKVEELFGGVDILINNAGAGSKETIMDAPDEKWQHYWDLHVMAAVRMTRALVPLMQKKGGGVILSTASICAKQPLFYEPIYNTTKAALMMLSKCMANEFIKENIRVNCINPGLVLTPDWISTANKLTEGTETTWEMYLDQIARDSAPIQRFATPEELAEFYVFLCSPLSSYCVGSTYYVDGGWLNAVA
jgi:NAD(P)-dependent dehydrogenase (short-subunit alcohol dehydrogenase family)